MNNAYNTNDPQKLLELKRLEADALLDVLRTINQAELNVRQLCLIARNVLSAQLGVRKMVFYYGSNISWTEGMRLGFRPFSEAAFAEVLEMTQITRVNETEHPALRLSGAEYVVPVINQKEAVAYFIIAQFADTEIETQGDLIFIETLGNILAVAIRNRQLFQEKMEQEFIRKELEVAEIIQKQMLISDFSRFDSVDIYGLNVAHNRVGGDFYDVIKKDRDVLFACIADVSGKGIGAALLMSNLQANLRALCAQYNDLSSIIRELNQILYEMGLGEKFVTLFLARIDTRTRQLAYINAGHYPPLLLTATGSTWLSTGCLPLGIMGQISNLREASVTYQTGDLLFMFTDGVVEQPNAIDVMFGNENVEIAIEPVRQKTSREIVHHIRQALADFSAATPHTDDITMLSVKFY
ncbi:MAG: PP2C family protein-serine/threonine phosphatase [Bacteroidia bacterium]|nr:PP2C family protein-serine/threonine phosphatase [Bacteroidia bacterium]